MRTLLLLLAAAVLGLAQTESENLLSQSFESSTAGWMALGDGASVQAGSIGGRGALSFNYVLAPKRLAVLAMAAPASLPRAGRLRISLKTDHSTAMAVLLSEKKPGGGNYAAWFWAPANRWQTIELAAADFSVSDGPEDPVDADGKLDLDAVESIGILDLAQFFGTLKATASLPVRIADASGRHTLLLDRFDLLAGPPPRASAFDRGFLDWVSPGGIDLRLSETGNPLGERALQASYQHHDGELDILVRREGRVPIRPSGPKPERLAFDVASEREVVLLVSLEMKKPGGGEGPRYTLPIYAPGGREVFHVDLKLADFDGPEKFDAAEWRTTAIVDVTDADGPNTLWIGNVRTAGD
jgi:hypothetical protein